MSLPIITSQADCADFSKTVLPYLVQIYSSPNRLSASTFTDLDALQNLPRRWAGDYENLPKLITVTASYLSTNPVATALTFSIATFPIFLIVSEINKNYSQVDRVWSILPTLFNVHYAVWTRLNGLPSQKVDNVLAFSVLWTLRLTFNYWRRGGYKVGSEDYRWEIVQKYIGQPWFFLLNLLFISTLQVLLLFAVTTPTYILVLTSRFSPKMLPFDYLFSRAQMALIVVEWFADQQQWDYHQAKQSYQSNAKVPKGWTRAQMDRGFNTTGLWRFSRHPNFAAEQTIWLVLYLWGCYESQTWMNWTFAGVAGYMLVFQGSTPLTEWISKSKYPEYKFYQQRVGKFLPKFGKGWDEEEMVKVVPKLLEDEKKKEKTKAKAKK